MQDKIELALKKAIGEKKVKETDLFRVEKKFSGQCRIKSNSRLFMIHDSEPKAAEEVRKLSAYIFEKLPLPDKNTILMTSPIKEDGKTVLATNLAIAISQHYREHSLLVELDFRNPRLQEFFDFPKESRGLCHYLDGEVLDLPDIFYRSSDVGKLSLVPAGRKAKNPAEAVHSPKMHSFFEDIKGKYDDRYIICDSPPVLYTTEPRFLASLVDAIVLVVNLEHTPRETIEEAISSLGKEKILGIILNEVTDSSLGHYDYDYYSY